MNGGSGYERRSSYSRRRKEVTTPDHAKRNIKIARFLSAWSGLNGDVVQFGVVLRHLQKYRPNWKVHVVCGRGKHTALTGLCERVFHDQLKEQPDQRDYDSFTVPGFYENHGHHADKPNSKATACLQELFGIAYDPSLGRYTIKIEEDARYRTAAYLTSIGCKETKRRFNAVIIHAAANTSPHLKDLATWQTKNIIETILRAKHVPVILDWDNRNAFADNKSVHTPGVGHGDLWGGFGSGDAETIAALIDQSAAFIGVDSGPGKVASATETPTLIAWMGHHPGHFHDPAPNTIHLVPHFHEQMEPLRDFPEVAAYFRKNYRHQVYEQGGYGLLKGICSWLTTVIGGEFIAPPIKYVLPSGIGDSVWALHKIRAVNEAEHGGKPIDIILSGWPGSEIDKRSVPFLKRFPFIRDVEVLDVPVLANQGNVSDREGRYVYQPDGLQGCHHFLCPNGPLERGRRLEDWLPEYPCDWGIIDQFSFAGTQNGTRAGKELGKFVAFYLGPESGNLHEGHNRGSLWTPDDWAHLGRWFQSQGCRIAIVGAPYDRSYFEGHVKRVFVHHGILFEDKIGAFEIGECFAFLREAKCLISYQCGLGILTTYLGGNVVMWWRPDQNSIHPHRKICFDERMATAWCNPKYLDRYLPCIYGRESADDICYAIDSRGWVK